MTNVGNLLTYFALGDATGVSPLHTTLDKQALGWLFMIGMLLKTVGTQWQGMASADNNEVKYQLGLNTDGTRPENPLARVDAAKEEETVKIQRNGGEKV